MKTVDDMFSEESRTYLIVRTCVDIRHYLLFSSGDRS